MSRWIRPLLAFAALACAPRLVFADDSAAPDSAKLFSQLDANSDGAVTKDEIPEDKQPLLRRLMRIADKNSDGKLSRDEFVDGLKGTDKPGDKDGGRPRRPGGEGNDRSDGGGPGLEALFGRMDKNSDGRVTPEEVPEERRERFKTMLTRLDSNSDGALSKDEMGKGRPGGEGDPGANKGPDANARPGQVGKPGQNLEQVRQRLKEADKNDDGKLSKDEMPERLAPLFGRLDKDGDGQVDGDELRAGLAQMRERAAQLEKKDQKPDNKTPAKNADARKRKAKAQAAKKRDGKPGGRKKPDGDGKPE